ncbi:MAG: hypothetical protein F4124_02515 [Acidimicrobiia bacterium]|nr:hypothetical protein [bacterium]MXW58651.1 hypothetical protein [Acidimicrobiia bacterium]MDE0613478.1 hypothetical protein [bacterium]MXZ77875.1 hypothetical protein [Acidimicrobiia bacterium]MXZ84112.1 hypothetical protein [Acidimicrobiia bacterium]
MAGGSDLLDRRERVVLAEDLAGVAEGTSGEVMLHTGITWLRYWVRFDSGAERGSIHRDKLVREAEWEDFLVKRAEAEAAAEVAAESGGELGSGSGDQPAAEVDDGASEDVVVNGATLPAHLLARSASARERLGG